MSESVRRAKARLGSYPAYLAACTAEGAAYAKCVAPHMGEVNKNQCQPQFEAFKACIVKQAKAAGKKTLAELVRVVTNKDLNDDSGSF